jgi:hypothetical protein
MMAKKVLTQNLSEPLCGETTAKVDIHTGTGNLSLDRLANGEQVLASGTLQYIEGQDLPARSVDRSASQATLTLKASGAGQRLFRFPWAACNGATDWQIHLNPHVQSDITAYSGGGNVKLNLAGMAVTRVSADTGGGNMEVVLPDHAADLGVTARTGGGNVSVEIGRGTTGSSTVCATSGAGNVVVRLPDGMAARIHATSGMGKVIVDSRFSPIDKNTYQSPDYEGGADKVEIEATSGAGNVTVTTR